MLRTSIWIITTLCLTPQAHAGPWVRDVGSGWAKVGPSTFRSSSGFASGQSTGLPYRSASIETYVEVGLPGGLQLVASLPWVSATQIDANDVRYHHRWTGDLRLEIDRKLHVDRPLAIGFEVRIPTFRRPSSFHKAKGVTEEQLFALQPLIPELGDTNVDVTLKLLWGTSSQVGWFAAEAGPRLRSGGFAHGVYGSCNGGIWLAPNAVALTGQISANANVTPREPAAMSKELLAVRAGMLLGRGPGVELGIGTVPFARHTGTGLDVSAAAFVEW
jgi:hypothetical protein